MAGITILDKMIKIHKYPQQLSCPLSNGDQLSPKIRDFSASYKRMLNLHGRRIISTVLQRLENQVNDMNSVAILKIKDF